MPFPLPLFPFPLFPLSPVPPLPLPELPLDVLPVEPAVVATVVVAIGDTDAALAADALLLTAAAVMLELFEAVVAVFVELSLHTVAVPVLVLAFALRTRLDAMAPWARPFVTLWKFSLTSPSELEMRTTPAFGA